MAKWTEERKEAARIAYQEKMKSKEEVKVEEPKTEPTNTLNKVESFNGETVPPPEENESGLGFRMSLDDKVYSMLNTVKVLPPNLIKDGRHSKENIQALNCFVVTDEMMDLLYKDFKHEPF